MGFKDLTPEQQEQARACKSEEELKRLAKTFGVKLSDEELTAVVGGVIADKCINDLGCMIKSSRPECPVKNSCPTLFDCITDCGELAPCPDNMGPIPVPGPKE